MHSAYRALDAGINFFDSSPSDGKGLAEERLGKVLRGRRHETIVGTKAGKYGPDELDFSADRIRRASRAAFAGCAPTTSRSCNCTTSSSSTWEAHSGVAHEELVQLRKGGMCRLIDMTGYPTAMTRRVIREFDLDVTLSYALARCWTPA